MFIHVEAMPCSICMYVRTYIVRVVERAGLEEDVLAEGRYGAIAG